MVFISILKARIYFIYARMIYFIEGKRCLVCGKHKYKLYSTYLCSNCHLLLQDEHYCFHFYLRACPLSALFQYNGISRMVIRHAKFKQCILSAHLIAINFVDLFAHQLEKFQQCNNESGNDIELIVVPIPCSKNSLKNRGWDLVQIILSTMQQRYAFKSMPLLMRMSNIQQKKLDRAGRLITSKQQFKVDETLIQGIDASHIKILLLDDVVTTGATIEAAATLLKPYCQTIEAMVFAVD